MTARDTAYGQTALDRARANPLGSPFPGKLREYRIVRDRDGAEMSRGWWAQSPLQATEMWAQYTGRTWQGTYGYHASSVRRIDEETEETLRDA